MNIQVWNKSTDEDKVECRYNEVQYNMILHIVV